MPGMAANPKIFQYIKLPDKFECHYMHWIMPEKNESIENYSRRLLTQIKHQKPVLIGVSFGGIIVQEIAKLIPVKQLILISTVKSHNEFSPLLKKSLRYRWYIFFPSKIMHYIKHFKIFGITKGLKHKIKLYQIYMDVDHPAYLNWAIKNLLSWKQTNLPGNFVHIIGEKDKVFPAKYISDPKIIVPNGRHDMIIFKAKWFNRHLPELINTKY
jgi:pimeloyl-ACP methyl ester carboxylesterase